MMMLDLKKSIFYPTLESYIWLILTQAKPYNESHY